MKTNKQQTLISFTLMADTPDGKLVNYNGGQANNVPGNYPRGVVIEGGLAGEKALMCTGGEVDINLTVATTSAVVVGTEVFLTSGANPAFTGVAADKIGRLLKPVAIGDKRITVNLRLN